MQRVLMGLNAPSGPDFVAVYIDDVLVFSQTLTDHLGHLRIVISRIRECGPKLKPAKYNFVCEEVQYLGHVIIPSGLRTNLRLVSAVTKFPCPKNVSEVRRFIGLSSYYH